MQTNFWILILALIGFFISWHIHHKKGKQEKLVCYIGNDCDAVVHSRFSKFLGIPNEILGMVYYGLIAVAVVLPFALGSVLLVISGLAAIFSLILICIQAFVIKEWCEYCLVSATVSILIFIVEMMTMV